MSGDIAVHARGYGATPLAGLLVYQARRNGAYVQAQGITSSRSGILQPKPYRRGERRRTVVPPQVILEAVRDAGEDWLLADAWDEPYEPPADWCPAGRQARSMSRRERIEAIASLRFWDGADSGAHSGMPPPGFVTAAQAAGRLGVSRRTIERYKRELRGQEAS